MARSLLFWSRGTRGCRIERPPLEDQLDQKGNVVNRFKLLAGAGLLALGLGVATEGKAAPAWTFQSTNTNFTNGSWNFGNNFEVLSTVSVSGLGYYADPVTGNVAGNPVALFQCSNAACNGTGSLLASAVVDNTNPLTNFFRFVTIPTLTLAPGFYQIVGVSNQDNYTWNTNGFATDPAIRYVANTWQSTGTGSQPFFMNFVQNDQRDGYWGPNLFLGAPTFVPTPGALALFGIGLLGVAALRRRA